jgi:hypothetical protein
MATNLGGTRARRQSGFEVAARLGLVHPREDEIPLLNAVAAILLEYALSAREPAAAAPNLALPRQPHADPERARRRARQSACFQVRLISACEHLHVIVLAPDHEERRREQLEIRRFERLRLVRQTQGFDGSRP